MRILVISDTHGNFFKFKDVLEKHRDAELVFFLGDGKREYEDICDLFPERKILAVKGNCAFPSTTSFYTNKISKSRNKSKINFKNTSCKH